MLLPGNAIKIIREAIISAFPHQQQLVMMLHLELDIQQAYVPNGNTYNEVVYSLIIKLEAEGRIPDLIKGALRANPRNSKLQSLPQQLIVLIDNNEQLKAEINNIFLYTILFKLGLIKNDLINQIKQIYYQFCQKEYYEVDDNITNTILTILDDIQKMRQDSSSKETPLVNFAACLLEGFQQENIYNEQLENLKNWVENNAKLKTFTFEVATIEVTKKSININRSSKQAKYFSEDLGNNIKLEMVSIPGGSFMMGSPKDEEGHYDDQSPQHLVNIQPFFMGKFPVTQAQWQAVASLPQVNQELKSTPSYFQGENLPVEQVSWYDAVEFCDRLSRDTGKPYRLPSEAEWEYACRADTNTPFHFGEIITSELANYNANSTYGAGPKGEYREKTTDVGSFGIANAYGLYDMHGNVWEWCLDDWHNHYEGATKDGSPWFDNDNDNIYQKLNSASVLRGGSWLFNPKYCRCASRLYYVRAERVIDYNLGFRVVWGVGWSFR